MFDDILVPTEEEKIILYDASEEEAFEQECAEITAGLLSDDEEESDKAFERLLNI